MAGIAQPAVSAINGCGAWIDSHEKTLGEHGVTNVQVQASQRIASVVNAVSRVLAAEAALQDWSVSRR